MAFFSIITVTRNNLPGLRRTEESLRNQTCRDFQWIVIDGDSGDGTKAYLQTLDATTLSEPDRGIYDAMNKGIICASGNYLLFLNAGDTLAADDSLSHLKNTIKGQDFIYGDALENGHIKPARSAHKILLGMPTHHQAMLYRRECIGDLRYDTAYKIAADYKFTVLFLQKSRSTLYCPTPLCNFEPGGISQTQARQGRQEQYFIRKELKLCPFGYLILIYLAQAGLMALRRITPSFYWKIKQRRFDTGQGK